MKYFIWIAGLILAFGSLGCSQPFAFEVKDIDYDALGSGRLLMTSESLLQTYYIDVDEREAYYIPLPKNNAGSFAVDGAGKFIYTTSGLDIYRAEIGGWIWEKLTTQLPLAREELTGAYNFAVSPDNQRFYFNASDLQRPRRPLVSLDLETGETTDLSALTGHNIFNYSINPVSGEIAFIIQEGSDSTLQFYQMQGDGSDIQLIYSVETIPSQLLSPNNIMHWTVDGKEIVYILSDQEFIYRYDLASNALSKMPFYQELNDYNRSTRIAFSPDGERIAYGFREFAVSEKWNRDRAPYAYGEDQIVSFCEYSCYTAAEVYWWP